MTPERAQFIDQVLIPGLITREGGFVNRLDDRGKATNWGITAKTLGLWRKLGRDATPQEVKKLTEEEARAIYFNEYIAAPGFLAIEDPAVLEFVVDVGVMSSPRRATVMLQRALGVEADGIFGPVTLEALDKAYIRGVLMHLFAERIEYLGRLISGDRTDADKDGMTDSAENAAGWLNRTAGFIRRVA